MTWITPDELARALGVSVKTLRRQLAEAPPGLPGAPLLLGVGRTNHYMRWRSMEEAERWLRAYTEWRTSGTVAAAAPAETPAAEPRAPRPTRAAVRPVTQENEVVDWGAVRREITACPGTKGAQKGVPERSEVGLSRAKPSALKRASNR